jgi:hypothetical protein
LPAVEELDVSCARLRIPDVKAITNGYLESTVPAFYIVVGERRLLYSTARHIYEG